MSAQVSTARRARRTPAVVVTAARRRWARTPLRVRLVAAVLLLAVAALTLAGFLVTAQLRSILVGQVSDQLRQTAQGAARDPGGDGDFGRGDHQPRLSFDDVVVYLTPDGRQVSATTSTGDGPVPDLPALTVDQTLAHGPDPFRVGGSDGSHWLAVAVPWQPREGQVFGSVLVARDLSVVVDGPVSRLVVAEVLIGAGALALMALAAWAMVRRSLRPLVQVERTAAAIAAGDLSRRVPESDPRTEVGGLSQALNTMLGQIEGAFRERQESEAEARASEARMRRFVADASHELRTPLTSVRGFAELYRQRNPDADPEDARLMQRVEEEARRMGVLVEDMLLLARLDQQRPLDRAPVDLLALAADAVHDARALAPGRPISLEVLDGPSVPVVTGDEHRLRQVLGNLVTNALRHTPETTPVVVRVGTRALDASSYGMSEAAVLEVADQGPGLAPEDANRVFERFYRADSSRTRASGGSGLGLSIVAALTSAHGGRVELDTAPGRGATFRVLLPLAGSPVRERVRAQ
ncbi:MAG: sensor histidine kinase [Motilibacteraceae bacterium]